MIRKRILLSLAALAFLFSLALVVYPLVATHLNDKYQSTVQAEYTRELAAVDDDTLLAAKDAAQTYNESLLPIRYDREALDAAAVDYDSLLDLTGSGIMGYLEIPKIDVSLPIYHGTEESVLQKGVGHLIGSSLPIGGNGYHSVLTGHSGVAGKRLFSDLEQLTRGDHFYIHILGETLAYEVTELNTVLPHETELLVAIPGEDLCTLVTCTPYGVNSHRLLAKGSRIPFETLEKSTEPESQSQPRHSAWKQNYLLGLLIGCGSAAGAVSIGLLISHILRKRRKRHEA